MSPSLQDSLPLITPRIRFHPYHARPLPTITPRVRYDDLVQGRKRYEESIRARIQERVVGREDPRNRNPGGGENRMTETREAGNGLGCSDRLNPRGEEPTHNSPGPRGKTDPYSKPAGPPSRPKSGAMKARLLDEHGWTKEELKTVSDRLAALAKTRIDTKVRKNKTRKMDTIEAICLQVAGEFPALQLHLYEDHWVLKDLLKMALQSRGQ
ncbi:hypothetical protein EDD18DRAFT_1326555 [Armillaria luteobubalina]|uniref:Uncharacterized protein n=1 Tax=Armillaria luteobubalina TaxID=153913 RepID=A0AA39QNG8_9AGAR|nr:hypothetical protein EDD18DRAFT_1326555 [Armillaria luteobubalina]